MHKYMAITGRVRDYKDVLLFDDWGTRDQVTLYDLDFNRTVFCGLADTGSFVEERARSVFAHKFKR